MAKYNHWEHVILFLNTISHISLKANLKAASNMTGIFLANMPDMQCLYICLVKHEICILSVHSSGFQPVVCINIIVCQATNLINVKGFMINVPLVQ